MTTVSADKAGGNKRAGKSGAGQDKPKPTVSPGMAQYIEIRAANPDCLLFYRMGDFYELFFEDAETASQVLGIHLTKRGKYLGQDVPMAGVPVKAADEYLQKLIARGIKVAVCEQLEDPREAKKRGHNAVVRRDVVRIVSKGTITEDNLLPSGRNNYLSAVFLRPGGADDAALAFASLDLSTGEFLISNVAQSDLSAEIARLSPSEILLPDRLFEQAELRQQIEDSLVGGRGGAQPSAVLSPLPFAHFNALSGETALKAQLGVATLDAFGEFTRDELAAIGGLLKYVELTQLGAKPAIRPPIRQGAAAVMVIDAATRASLELLRTQSGDKALSLFGAIDRTMTGAGARALAARLASPLTNADQIAKRLDAVGFLVDDPGLRDRIRKHLKSCPDLARALSRIIIARSSPRDLGTVAATLAAAIALGELLRQARDQLGLPELLANYTGKLPAPDYRLFAQLSKALRDELPVHKSDGGFIRPGYHPELDESRSLRDESRQILAALQTEYSDETGIKALKIKHNNVLGYFIEVTALHGEKLMSEPLSKSFTHRQTLANVVRFTTPKLSEIEAKINRAADRASEIELEIYADLVQHIRSQEVFLAELADALAQLDCTAALGELADEQNYIRPVIDETTAFQIVGGRHPVVEQALKAQSDGPFIENDCRLGSSESNLDPARLIVLTGPNMAGKSTYLRQNALITVLAQMGSFVPAHSAHIGIVDRLFSRVGASDDLARGRSTFMVEMVETAAILNQASERSLVILDEIGRGTATYDGLSIAWATVEYLHEKSRSRALFATHYHELTALGAKLPFATNATIEVKEWRDEIVFLHRVISGAADRSYGIQVAKLAGLPESVIGRASEVLSKLETSGDKPDAEALADELPLFAALRPTSPVTAATAAAANPVLEKLQSVNPDELTPREALDLLYELHRLRQDH